MKNLISSIGILLSIIAIVAVLYLYNRTGTTKIAIVRTGEAMNRYIPMKEAEESRRMKLMAVYAKIDTLMANARKSSSEKIAGNLLVGSFKEQQIKIVEEGHRRLLEGLIDQFNKYIEEHAIRNNYEIILGTTLSGNVLYVNKPLDITEEIIIGLNQSYKAK